MTTLIVFVHHFKSEAAPPLGRVLLLPTIVWKGYNFFVGIKHSSFLQLILLTQFVTRGFEIKFRTEFHSFFPTQQKNRFFSDTIVFIHAGWSNEEVKRLN